jgi:hypothetical protein
MQVASTESGLVFGTICYDRSGSRATDQSQILLDDIRLDIMVCGCCIFSLCHLSCSYLSFFVSLSLVFLCLDASGLHPAAFVFRYSLPDHVS